MAISAPVAPGIPGAAPVQALPNNGSSMVNANRALQTPGTLNAVFPQTPVTQVPAPTVVTSQPAEDHIATVQTAANQANSDIAAQNTPTQPATSTAAPVSTSTAPDTTAAPADIQSAISDLLSGMTGENPDVSSEISQEQGVQSEDEQAISDLEDQQSSVADTMNALSSGTVPLTPSEQLQVANVGTTYQNALGTAIQAANNTVGGTVAATALSGLQMYSPAMAASDLKSAITAGQQKVSAVTAQIADAQSKLTTSLQAGDYKTASDMYTQIGDLIKDRQDEITNINTEINQVTTQQQDSEKNSLTALMDMNTISYQDKQQAIAQSTLDEKTQNDLASRAIAQEVAEKGSYTVHNMPDGSVGIFNSTTGQFVGSSGGTDMSANPDEGLVVGAGQDMTLNSSSPIVNSAFSVSSSGVPYLDMSELTSDADKQTAAQVAAQYQATTGTPLPMITAKNAPVLQNIDAARTDLAGIQDALASLSPSNGVTRPFDTFGHWLESKTQLGPTASDISSYEDWNASMLEIIKGLAGSGTSGARGASLVNTLTKDIPSYNDTASIAAGKIADFNKQLDAAEESIVGSQAFSAANPSSATGQQSSFLDSLTSNNQPTPGSSPAATQYGSQLGL